jgi:hypothetical protein
MLALFRRHTARQVAVITERNRLTAEIAVLKKSLLAKSRSRSTPYADRLGILPSRSKYRAP